MSNAIFKTMVIAAALGAGTGVRAQGADMWSDDFDGPAGTLPNPAKWAVSVTPNPANNEAQYYTNRTKNVALNGAGQLELIAFKESMGSKQYTSGKVHTQGKFTQQYGRWEARMKLPEGQGFWPAFWMLGINQGCSGWPSCGEIDIMENRGRTIRNSSAALHGPGYSGNTPLAKGYTLPTASPSHAEDFHVFAMEWTANAITWYVDGIQFYAVTRPDVTRYGNWAYDRPFYTILNLAVGGAFDGNRLPTDASLPAKVVVDWVRIYKQGASAIKPVAPRFLGRGGGLEAGQWSAAEGPGRDLSGRLRGLATRGTVLTISPLKR